MPTASSVAALTSSMLAPDKRFALSLLKQGRVGTEEHWGPLEQHSALLGRSAGQVDRAPGGLLVKVIAHLSGVCWSR